MSRRLQLARVPRFFVQPPGSLQPSGSQQLSPLQQQHASKTLRLKAGAALRLFDGASGEWAAVLQPGGTALVSGGRLRPPAPEPGPLLLFASTKATVDTVVRSATELGVAEMRPIQSERGVVRHTARSSERRRAIAVSAAEQSNRLTVPELRDPLPLGEAVAAAREGRRRLFVYCDVARSGVPQYPLLRLPELQAGRNKARDVVLLVGPEGGWSSSEREGFSASDDFVCASLGGNVLRSPTAAIAALALLMALAEK